MYGMFQDILSDQEYYVGIAVLQDVHKIYPLGNTQVHAVQGVSLDIQEGEFISIAGPSGSGKSTILNLIGCIDVPSEGTVVIGGEDTKILSDKKITDLRHRFIGFIFQSFNLIPVLTVYENIEFPLLLGKKKKDSSHREWIEHLVEEVGLKDWQTHRPQELSGGQRQRVAIARALATRPRMVLADEPTANLDSETGERIIELMKKINRDQGTTFIFSTHDQDIVGIADHVIRLLDGRIAEEQRRGQ